MEDRIPSEQECYRIMVEHEMLPNIELHSRQVMRVALALVDHLARPGIVNRDLVLAAALLHDIAKTAAIRTRDHRHDLKGGEILRAMGCEAIARIVESHVVLDDFAPQGPLEERELVFYADKRVMHDRIVSLDERVADLADRYGINERIKAMIHENKDFVLRLETKIRGFLSTDLEAIIDRLKS